MTSTPNDLSALQSAILHTVSYADIFDYPLKTTEIHRYLTGLSAPLEVVEQALPGLLQSCGAYYSLPGREALAAIRQRREGAAARLWPIAVRFGRWIARLPFVRMVAVTGSLAMDNVEPDADLDYLIVTTPGRLWTCRAFTLALGRLAALWGVRLCPNYLVSQRALEFTPQNIYVAHELTQMVPLAGLDVYSQIRACNRWVENFLPNAADAPLSRYPPPVADFSAGSAAWLEALLLQVPSLDQFEAWEMQRKIRKLQRENIENPEAIFSPDCCKGHSQRHAQKTLSSLKV